MRRAPAGLRRRLRGIREDPGSRLRLPLLLHGCFAGFYLCSALRSRSPWMGTMAFYYLWLCAQRALLLTRFSCGAKRQWAAYTRCGVLLLLSSLVIMGMNLLLLHGDKALAYPFYLIYGVAAYAFYSLTAAILHVIRSRRQRRPILMANRELSLVSAMISMLSMESALLTAFGDDDAFSRAMLAMTGFAIFAAVVLLSAAMIRSGGKQQKAEAA